MVSLLPRCVARPTVAGLVLTVMAAAGCTSANPPSPAEQADPDPSGAPPPHPTGLDMDFASWASVRIDGETVASRSDVFVPVDPGPHTVTVETSCQKVEFEVDAPARRRTRIGLDHATALRTATLELEVAGPEGKLAPYRVLLGDRQIGETTGFFKVLLPACTSHIVVASEGFGRFIEDIDFSADATQRRTITLAPGPDMVRIAGGAFTPGMPADLEVECYDQPPPRRQVEVPAFDLDRTEVTAAQWMACRDAGGCQPDRTKDGVTKPALGADAKACNVVIRPGRATLVTGREAYPMNCISQWEAEAYCEWAGKRLPTDLEWEFAARSRNSEAVFPWGTDDSACNNAPLDPQVACQFDEGALAPPCSFAKTNTEQGVCDMAGSLSELTRYAEFPGRDDTEKKRELERLFGASHRSTQYTMGTSWGSVSVCDQFINGQWSTWHRAPREGFRCARSVDTSTP
ncbi:MAG: formylglycine-generating enzyme family protein [Myxococcota bacterium]